MGARGRWAPPPARVIGKYIVPNASSHIIVMATLYVPEYLLVESGLSFLGLGLTPPLTSWGVLPSDAQKVRVVRQLPVAADPGPVHLRGRARLQLRRRRLRNPPPLI